MPRALDTTILDISTVVRPSIASNDSTQIKPSKVTAGKPTSNVKLLEFNKLRGKPKVKATEHLEAIFKELPSLQEEQAKAVKALQEKIDAIDIILDTFGADAEHLPLDALGDFTVLASNPVPFAEAVKKAADEYNLRSPDANSNKVLPDNRGSKLKTSTSLNRLASKNASVASSNASSSSMKSTTTTRNGTRTTSKSRAQATPLNNRVTKKTKGAK